MSGSVSPIEVEVRQREDGTDSKGAPGIWEVVVTDRAAGRAWSGSDTSLGDAATEAVRGFLGDRRSAEYVK